MRRFRDAVLVLAVATAIPARADEALRAFLDRHGLVSTERQWLLEQLDRSGSAQRDAARLLAGDMTWLERDASRSPEERGRLLQVIVEALPENDRLSVRPRLELARQRMNLAIARIEAARGGRPDPQAVADAAASLAQVETILRPALASQDAVAADLRTPAMLMDGWRRALQGWLGMSFGADRAGVRLPRVEIDRAVVMLARLVDADTVSPSPRDCSRDLLATELGAEAALGLAVALAARGDWIDAVAWLEALPVHAARTAAAARAAVVRLGLAVDRRDLAAMRSAIEHVPARMLPADLARAAAAVASLQSGPDAWAVIAGSLEAMAPADRDAWLSEMASGTGALAELAAAMRDASQALPAWQRGEGGDTAGAAALALRRTLEASGALSPKSLQAEALRLLGWALWMDGQPGPASEAFEQAAVRHVAVRPECLWMAAYTQPAQDEAGRARRLDLLQRQRDADPQGPFAGRVAVWTSRLDGFPNAAVAVAVLLDVPPHDDFVAQARCEAARRLLMQAGQDPPARVEAAQRALRVLEPFAADPATAPWRLMAATTDGAQDAAVVHAVLPQLSPEDRADPAVATALVRWHAARDDVQAAMKAVDSVERSRRASEALAAAFEMERVQTPAARLAAVELAWSAAAAEDPATRAAATDRLARGVLQASREGVALPTSVAVGAALALGPHASASVLHGFALSEAERQGGQAESAIERLQALTASLPQGEEPWLEGRWWLLQALRAVDEDRAQAMLQQHMALLPDGGAEPWGGRFRQAAGELERQP
jgi:hypothetical protein